MIHELTKLLGHSRWDSVVAEYVDLLGEPQIVDREDEISLDFEERGVSLIFDGTSTVICIQLYGAHRDGFKTFEGELPQGLDFEFRRTEVREKLGPPSAHGGGAPTLLYERSPLWDRYEYPGWSLHIEYADTGRISLVSLMTTEATPTPQSGGA